MIKVDTLGATRRNRRHTSAVVASEPSSRSFGGLIRNAIRIVNGADDDDDGDRSPLQAERDQLDAILAYYLRLIRLVELKSTLDDVFRSSVAWWRRRPRRLRVFSPTWAAHPSWPPAGQPAS